MTQATEHLDRLGEPVLQGSVVVYAYNNSLAVGMVTKINPKMIRVQRVGSRGNGTLKYSTDCLVIDDARASFWLLKNSN